MRLAGNLSNVFAHFSVYVLGLIKLIFAHFLIISSDLSGVEKVGRFLLALENRV